MKKLHSKSAKLMLVATLLASSAAWAIPQMRSPDRTDGVRITQAGYNSHHVNDSNDVKQHGIQQQQMQTGGGDSK